MRYHRTVHFGRWAAVAAIALLQGCASLYLHSSDMEARTQAAKDDLAKINIDKTFTEAKARLDAFAVDEEAGVLAYAVAQRDAEIAGLVRPNLLRERKTSSIDTLQANVAARARQVLGDSGKLADRNVADLPQTIDLLTEDADVNRSFYLLAVKEFGALAGDKDTRATTCDTTPPRAPAGTTPVDVAYERLVEACAALNAATATLAQARKNLAPTAGSELAVVAGKAKRSLDIMTEQAAAAGRIQAAIKKLQEEPPSNAKELEAQIDKIRALLGKAKGLAAAAGAEEISKILEGLLAADLSAKPAADAPPPSALTKGTLAVLELTTALAKASDAFSAQPQVVRVNSTLLALAEQRQALDMAKLTIEQQRAEAQLYAAEELALIREVALLSTTHRIAIGMLRDVNALDGFAPLASRNDAARQGAGGALAAYVDSWNQGRIPYIVLRFREYQVERDYIVQRAAKTAKNWTALLSPPLDDLVAYGKGGIRPETVATVITNLGIMGAILGK